MKKFSFRVAILLLLLANDHAHAKVFYVNASSSNPVPPYTNWLMAATSIQDAVAMTATGDQIWVTNGVYQYGSIYYNGLSRTYVSNAISVQSVNGPLVTVIAGGQTPSPVRCAYLVSGAMLSGFTLTNGANEFGAGVYCQPGAFVTNCIISGNQSSFEGGGAYGGTLENCLLMGNTIPGAGSGAYSGGGAYQSTLYSCKIISNSVTAHSSGRGGGVYFGIASNCVIAGNFADQGGGGAAQCTLLRCILIGNSAINTNSTSAVGFGGGSAQSALSDCLVVSNSVGGGTPGVGYGGGCYSCYQTTNCTITANSALGPGATGGGVFSCSLYNCIVYSNSAPTSPNQYSAILYYSCTTPLPATGLNNFTNAPLFVNPAAGDFHLQSNSPCINSGGNGYATFITNDLDGNPRTVGGTVDMGAFEYQAPASILSYAWAEQYGLPIDGSADFLDSDGTGMANWEKSVAGLNPTNPTSVFLMSSIAATNSSPGIIVTWRSVNTRTYYLQRAMNISAQPAFSAIHSNIFGQAGFTSFTDATAVSGGPYFYRVGVQ